MSNISNQKLKKTAVDILRDPSLQSIHFEYNAIVVTGMRYAVVADMIMQGRITCNVGVSQADVPKTSGAEKTIAGAQYDPTAHQLLFPNENFADMFYKKTEYTKIVHEATHAILDVFHAKSILAIDDEIIAWLASALYCRFGNGEMQATFIDGCGDTALKLADRLIAKNPGQRTYTVSTEEAQKLRDAVINDYQFKEGRAGILDVYTGVPATR